MALPKKGGGLAVLFDKPAAEEDGDMDTGSMAAEDFLAAIESKDPAAVKSAFQAMYDECAMGPAAEDD